jgi:hypothetical protein
MYYCAGQIRYWQPPSNLPETWRESRVWPAKLEAADRARMNLCLKYSDGCSPAFELLVSSCSSPGAPWAIYYSNLPWGWPRLVLALFFLTFGVWVLWVSRTPRKIVVFAALFLGVVVWFSSIKPSHDRPWRPEVAVMPRAFIDGDSGAHHRRPQFRLPEPG